MGVSFVFASPQEEGNLAQVIEDVAAMGRSAALPGSTNVRIAREAAPEILAKVIKQISEKGVLTKQELIDLVNANQ
jgi:hypothetical protein